jgi:C4-dicarboxylate-specific signal transduction histidine kinase
VTAPELPSQFGTALPALLDALRYAEVGVIVFFHHGGKTYKLYANDAAVMRLGYTAAEWMMFPMGTTLAPEMREVVAQLYTRGDAPTQPLELMLRHRDGRVLRGEFTMASAAIESGIVFFVISRDFGHRLQTQLSLLEADRVALVGALAAGFAHEINNPLTSIVLNLRSLRKQFTAATGAAADPTLALRYLDDLAHATERIASNVRAFQTLATPGQRDRVDLAAVVTSALRLAAPTLEPRAAVLRSIVAQPQVMGEDARIGQAVLAMLLFASSGFAEPNHVGNQICVVVELRRGDAVVEVSDNGRALGEDEAVHAFDPFFRSHTRGAGVGVGLGVARSIATTLGGAVNLAAREDGGGAVITMRLPPVT